MPRLLTLLRRGAARRCPACGEGRIFASFLRLRPACPGCGWVVERESGAVTGPMYLIAVFSQLFAVALLLLFWGLTDWTDWLKVAVAVPLIALFSLGALPVAKGLWVAVDYYTDLATGETEEAGYGERAFRKKKRRGGGGEPAR